MAIFIATSVERRATFYSGMQLLGAIVSAAVSWHLADVTGAWHDSAAARAPVTVLVFLAPDCTISERSRPALTELHESFAAGGSRFFGVVAGRWPRETVQRLRLAFPILLDPNLELTRQTGARVTPEAFVIDAKGAIVYRGRVDGLREALDDVAAGRAVKRPILRATGCTISGLDARPAAKGPGFAETAWPVLSKHCVECHRTGGPAPFSLATYADAAPRAAAIAEAVTARRMPPWKPDPGPPHFLGERRLTAMEMAALVAWARGGAAEGSAGAPLPPVPPAAEWRLGTPDRVSAMSAPFAVPAGGADLYRCFVIPAGLDRDQWVKAFEFRPGEPRAVHHALIFVDHSRAARRRDAETPEPGYPCFGVPGFLPSSSLGGWAPGTGAVTYPEGAAVRLRKDADLVLQLHYAPGGERREDRSSVGLYFTEAAPTRRMMDIALGSRDLDIPAGAAAYRVHDSFTTPVDVIATGIIPHAHFIARTMRGWAMLPDGRRINLLTIRDWDFNWQQQYRYREPIAFPAGTRFEMEFVYDNSAANPRNPSSPPRRVRWGPDSTDEMAGLHVQVTPLRDEDAEELGRSMWGKLMREIQRR